MESIPLPVGFPAMLPSAHEPCRIDTCRVSGDEWRARMRRFGQVIGLDRDRVEEYRKYHAKIWPEIEEAIRQAGICNYSIYLDDDRLFAYLE